MNPSKRSKHSKQQVSKRSEPNVITANDLPAGNDIHWNLKRKAVVVSAVLGGIISIRDACARYELSVEEFLTWKRAAMQMGIIVPCAASASVRERPPLQFRLAA